MYRTVTLRAQEAALAPVSSPAWTPFLEQLDLEFRPGEKLFAGGEDVSDKIRSREVTGGVSAIAAIPEVRAAMGRLQRGMGEAGSLVCEGRDMGSVVFPDAAARIYLDASPEIRAQRRQLELKEKNQDVDFDVLLAEIKARDAADSSRAVAPLKRVPGQKYLDSSDMTRAQVVDRLYAIACTELGSEHCSG